MLARVALPGEPAVPRAELCDLLQAQAAEFDSGPRALSNIDRLCAPGTVAVVTILRPALFGGPLYGWLKVFTAARLATWITEAGHAAVPVAWIDSNLAPADSRAGILAPKGPEQLVLEPAAAAGSPIADQVEELLARVSTAVRAGAGDSDVLGILNAAYRPGAGFVRAWRQTVSRLLDFCGIVILDPSEPGFRQREEHLDSTVNEKLQAQAGEQQQRMRAAGYGPDEHRLAGGFLLAALLHFLPAAVIVTDENYIYDLASDAAMLSESQQKAPVVWPRSSATVLSARDQKTWARYALDLKDMYSGSAITVNKLIHNMSTSTPGNRLESFRMEIEQALGKLAAQIPDDKLRSTTESARRRMVYQVDKLKRGFYAVHQLRRYAVTRQVTAVCNALAPWGLLQERELAGFQFVFRHSRALPQRLCESIDIWNFEHQLIQL